MIHFQAKYAFFIVLYKPINYVNSNPNIDKTNTRCNLLMNITVESICNVYMTDPLKNVCQIQTRTLPILNYFQLDVFMLWFCAINIDSYVGHYCFS